MEAHTKTLRQEIRPLRGTNDPVGSDIRFPFFAKAAGFDLWLDPSVVAAHILFYPLKLDDYMGPPDTYRDRFKKETHKRAREARRGWRQRLAALDGAE
jgi:hypothetical protein